MAFYFDLKQKYKKYVLFYEPYLRYDTSVLDIIDESDAHVTFNFVADMYPEKVNDTSNLVRNGQYSTTILDIPFNEAGNVKSVSSKIKIQKWIDRETKEKYNSPVPFLDTKHNATQRMVKKLKEDIVILESKDIVRMYGINESYISMIYKEIVKEGLPLLAYLDKPQTVKIGYICKGDIRKTPYYIFFVIDKNKKTISLAEWQRTSGKLLDDIDKYLALDIIYVGNNIGVQTLKSLRSLANKNAFDLQYAIKEGNIFDIEHGNWKNLPSLSPLCISRIEYMLRKLEMNRLSAKKNLYRVIYGNQEYK